MRHLLLLSTLLISCAPQPGAPPGPADAGGRARPWPQLPQLDAYLDARRAEANVPGMQVAIVKGGAVVWAGAYGVADLATGSPVTLDTTFLLASSSKTVTATAAMQAVEDGLLSLAGDVDGWAGFDADNPRYPQVDLTLEHLLTHTSSIRDNWDVLDAYYVRGDSSVPLGQYMFDYVDDRGANYDRNRNWLPARPGNQYAYANMGMSLAGWLVESASGVPFDTWCEQRIFAPLGMNDTGWHLADVDLTRVAHPHTGDPRVSRPHYGYPDYPDGGLRSSAEQMGGFLAMFTNGGTLDGVRVLDQATVRDMITVRVPGQGQALGWYTEEKFGELYMGHNGGDVGATSEMFFRMSDRTGFVVLMNSNASPWSKVLDIEEMLMKAADQYL